MQNKSCPLKRICCDSEVKQLSQSHRIFQNIRQFFVPVIIFHRNHSLYFHFHALSSPNIVQGSRLEQFLLKLLNCSRDKKKPLHKSFKNHRGQIQTVGKVISIDLEADQIAEIAGLNRNTVNRYLMALRERISEYCQEQAPSFGVAEVDESYFGARRVKGKRGRGAHGKTIVFGIYKRNGKVYTEIVPNVTRKTLHDIIRGRVEPDNIIHSDT